ncbi:hypothetical protein EUTSA_v10025466mg [Eutrema salsugineum]|uniref:KIB1-4 beta-propeller domain-containing protein n=1 Tax=Eutrema salsugineum TaxID=72664 RepID=V4MG63_EUTSA|nr:F-box protein At5g25290 [Eutrema salsugineum]ESQ55499.1 hypothetical protein EUTSA_v10025466mg [Eutrema salsugineum]
MEGSTLKRRWSCPDTNLILRPKRGSPLLLLSPEEEDGCRLYSPDEDRVYETTTRSDFSGYRILGNSDNWFLVVDSRSDLYIVDVFSEERIHLPPLESIKGNFFKLERAGDKEFSSIFICKDGKSSSGGFLRTADDLRGLLWVDDKNGDYVVVWRFFGDEQYLGFCKKGDDHYREISMKMGVRWELRGRKDMVLKGYSLYILATRDFIRHLDLSRQDGFEDVSMSPTFPMWSRDILDLYDIETLEGKTNIEGNSYVAVTTSGEVFIVKTKACESNFEKHRMFRLFKRDPKDVDTETNNNIWLVEVDSVGGGDEALFLDLGTTVPADHTLGIEPNCIYFSRDRNEPSPLDICVYNLATKTIKRFPSLSSFKLKDAWWFLPS